MNYQKVYHYEETSMKVFAVSVEVMGMLIDFAKHEGMLNLTELLKGCRVVELQDPVEVPAVVELPDKADSA
jgi:hypothetical protein